MHRPCFLVIDREFPGTVSTRKLVIETAKMNVITAYSGREALETFRRFPGIDGIVLDAGLRDMDCSDIIREVKQQMPRLPVLVIEHVGGKHCPGGDFYLPSFDPTALLTILKQLRPADTEAVIAADRQAEKEVGEA